jgi:hypothetical protein
MIEDSTGERVSSRRGRPRLRRLIREDVSSRCFAPECWPDSGVVSITLLPEEIELLRLIDLDGLEQEEAASVLGVSRRTVWRDLHAARRKVADALTSGKVLQVGGCPRAAQGLCPRNCPRFSPKKGQDDL